MVVCSLHLPRRLSLPPISLSEEISSSEMCSVERYIFNDTLSFSIAALTLFVLHIGVFRAFGVGRTPGVCNDGLQALGRYAEQLI